MARINIKESPMIISFRIPLLLAWHKPCHNAIASAWLLVAMPRPTAYRTMTSAFGFTINPPPPAWPGLPFEDPSKDRMQSVLSFFHLSNLFFPALISQIS